MVEAVEVMEEEGEHEANGVMVTEMVGVVGDTTDGDDRGKEERRGAGGEGVKFDWRRETLGRQRGRTWFEMLKARGERGQEARGRETLGTHEVRVARPSAREKTVSRQSRRQCWGFTGIVSGVCTGREKSLLSRVLMGRE